MCLQAQGIDNNDNRGVGRGRGIRNAPDESETMTEAAGSRRQARVIYDGKGDVRGGR